MKLVTLVTVAVMLLLFRAWVLMLAWGAVANTFNLPSLSYGVAIAVLLVVTTLTSHMAPRTPVQKTAPKSTQARINDLLADLERKQGIRG